MGCNLSSKEKGSRPIENHVATLPVPTDDVLTWVCGLEGGQFAVSGSDGTVNLYDSDPPRLARTFQAHKKAVNRLLPLHGGRLLTASADATVRIWNLGPDGTSGSDSTAFEPEASLTGHLMSVRAMDFCGGASSEASPVLFTGARDCTVRLWDVATATQLHENKILRNVVTAVCCVPGADRVMAQASEDLQLRLWDARAGLKPAEAKPAGPHQLICMDVSDDGRYVACGSKGFSRENCEVKVFDLRGGLRPLASTPCADQTIEALRMTGPDRCLIASKDCCLRSVALPEPEVQFERGPGAGAYTALGVVPRATQGPLVLATAASPAGASLELLSWPDAELRAAPSLLASSQT